MVLSTITLRKSDVPKYPDSGYDFRIPFDLQRALFLQVFELHSQSNNQKVSPWSGESIGAHHVSVRAVARALSGSKDERENANF